MAKQRGKQVRYTCTTIRFDRANPKDRERLRLIDGGLISKSNLFKYALDQVIKQIKEGKFLVEDDMTDSNQEELTTSDKERLEKGFQAYSDEDF